MTKQTLKSAVSALTTVLKKRSELEQSIADQLQDLKDTESRILEFINAWDGEKLPEVPEIVAEKAPFVAFQATEKTIGRCIDAAMQIKHELIPSLENTVKPTVDSLKAQYELLEGYALQHLEAAGVSSTKSDAGRVESRVQTRYTVADKSLFIKAMQELGAESELTITVRPNSKALGKIVEETGEVPAGLSLSRSKIACFVKT